MGSRCDDLMPCVRFEIIQQTNNNGLKGNDELPTHLCQIDHHQNKP